ncbi:SE1561 family protein [Salisediminibacterium beveridgei]|nr:SE1561 family protein [Salisediminibacterium beveridgei]
MKKRGANDMNDQPKVNKLEELHNRMEKLSEMLDELDPEKTEVEDIDRLLLMLDDLEKQCQHYREQ